MIEFIIEWLRMAALTVIGAAAETERAAGLWYTPCLFRILTGLYCPGCGGTRAVRALFKGKMVLSFLYHPLVLYTVTAAVGCLVWYVYCRTKKKTFPQRIWKNVLFAGIILLILNFLIKNSLLLFCDIDVLSLLDGAV